MSEAMTQHSTARARSVAFCGLSHRSYGGCGMGYGSLWTGSLHLADAGSNVCAAPCPPSRRWSQSAAISFSVVWVFRCSLPFKGGLAALMGPTGSFIVGFFVAAVVAIAVASLLKRTPLFASKSRSFFGTHIAAGVLARNVVMGVVFLAVLYVFGWAWLMVAGDL